MIKHASGFFAMLIIHSASLPSLLSSLTNPLATLPPLSMIVMVWIGLAILSVRAIQEGDRVYIFGNLAGLLTNSLVMACILMK